MECRKARDVAAICGEASGILAIDVGDR